MQKRRDHSAILLDQQVGSRVRLRRLMLKLSQTDLADGLGLTFQQVQKYEKGMNPSPNPPPTVAQDQSLAKLNDFMATRDGLTLAKAFMRIGDTKLRRRIVDLVEQIERDRD
jgi:transcriptional regulator with XRE-family HTH domain